MRASRTIRDRLVKKRKPSPRIAKTLEINEHGLKIDGAQLPYFVGTDITVDHIDDDFKIVTLSIFTEAFSILPDPLPQRTTLTEIRHGYLGGWTHPSARPRG